MAASVNISTETDSRNEKKKLGYSVRRPTKLKQQIRSAMWVYKHKQLSLYLVFLKYASSLRGDARNHIRRRTVHPV